MLLGGTRVTRVAAERAYLCQAAAALVVVWTISKAERMIFSGLPTGGATCTDCAAGNCISTRQLDIGPPTMIIAWLKAIEQQVSYPSFQPYRFSREQPQQQQQQQQPCCPGSFLARFVMMAPWLPKQLPASLTHIYRYGRDRAEALNSLHPLALSAMNGYIMAHNLYSASQSHRNLHGQGGSLVSAPSPSHA